MPSHLAFRNVLSRRSVTRLHRPMRIALPTLLMRDIAIFLIHMMLVDHAVHQIVDFVDECIVLGRCEVHPFLSLHARQPLVVIIRVIVRSLLGIRPLAQRHQVTIP